MTTTENYGLKLPAGTEAPDVAVFNDNFKTIDEQLKTCENQIELGDKISD